MRPMQRLALVCNEDGSGSVACLRLCPCLFLEDRVFLRSMKRAKEYKETRENCYMVLYLLAIVT